MSDLEARIAALMLEIHERPGSPYLDDRDSAREWAPIFARALEAGKNTVDFTGNGVIDLSRFDAAFLAALREGTDE